jgi:hypothetical protein
MLRLTSFLQYPDGFNHHMMGESSMRWGEEAPVQSLGPLHVHFEGDRAPSEEVDPNDLPGGDQVRPFVVSPCPGIPIAPDALYFRDGELVHILGRLVWFESNGNHMIIQDTQDSHGPRDPESICRAIVDLRDDMGSAHQNLFCMQNVMDDHRVEQVKMEEMVQDMSVRLHQLEKHYEMFILDKWASFQSIILQSLSTIALAGQACLRSHTSYRLPPSSLAAGLDAVYAGLQEFRSGLESPQSLGGLSSSVPSLVSVSSSSSQSSPIHVQIHPRRWQPLSPVRSDGSQASEDPVQQEDQGYQAEVYTSGSEEGVVVPYRQLL